MSNFRERQKIDAMNRYKTKRLTSLIIEIATAYGELQDVAESYAKEQASEWSHDLDAAIACFNDLKGQLHLIDKKTNKLRS